MSLIDKAKAAAEQAKQAATQAAGQARSQSGSDELKSQFQQMGRWGRKSLVSIVDRIDPGVLASLIIKATAAQEQANEALVARGSPYRIAEITITATLPPQLGFGIQRVGDPTDEEKHSTELVAQGEVEIEPGSDLLTGADDDEEEEVGS